MSASSIPALRRLSVVRPVRPLSASMPESGLSSRFSVVRAVCPARADRVAIWLPEALRLSSEVSEMSGERLVTLLFEISSDLSPGMDASADMLVMPLPERFRLSSLVHTARADMSVIPLFERSSSVTSLVKVCPPRLISVTVAVGSSEIMLQPARASCRASNSSSVISRPLMSSVVSFVSE